MSSCITKRDRYTERYTRRYVEREIVIIDGDNYNDRLVDKQVR